MKRAIAWLLAIVLVGCGLCGCQKKTATKDLSWEKISAGSTLKVGIDPMCVPMTFLDSEGDATGFEFLLAKEVCARLGLTMKIVEMDRKDAAARLKDGTIDCFWSGLVHSEENDDAMELMAPYLRTSYYVAVKNDAEAEQLIDLTGKKLGVIRTQSSYRLLLKAEHFLSLLEGGGFRSFDAIEEASEEMDSGKIDALILDSATTDYYQNLGKDIRLLQNGMQTESLLTEELPSGFREGEVALREKIEEGIATMRRDGSLERLSIAWFGKNVLLSEDA